MGKAAVLGLDIGTRMMKFCEVRAGREGPELVSYGASPTPTDAISTGVIIDPQLLGQAIRDMLSEYGARTKRVNCAIQSSSSLVIRQIEVPKMSDSELAETMRWEVERYVPFAISEMLYDYKPLVAVEDLPEDAANMEVLMAAGQQDMIQAYVDTLAAAKLDPICLDVEPLSAARALIDINADEGAYDKVIALLDIGAGNTDITIMRRGVLAFNRSVAIAGDNLTNAISESMSLDFAEAERLKVDEGMLLFDPSVYRPALGGTQQDPAPPPAYEPQAGPPVIELARAPVEDDENAPAKPVFDLGAELPPPGVSAPPVPTTQTVGDTASRRVFESMAPTLADLVTEVRRSLDFYSSRFPQSPIDAVIVYGGTARLPHFEQFLTNELGTPVVLADPFRRLFASGDTSELKQLAPLFSVAAGMGIRDMIE